MSTENWGENFSVPRNRHEAVELDIWSLEAFFFFQTEDFIPFLYADENNLVDKKN